MKILVLGHGGHGKGTFCRMLEDLSGLRSVSSSRAALSAIWPALRMCTSYSTAEQAYENRRHHRGLWKELISLYNTPDKSALARAVLQQADVYDGMRCAEEYEASSGLFDYILWVDAGERAQEDPSMTIEYDRLRMGRIDNNGTLEDLRREAECFVAAVSPSDLCHE